MAVWPDQPTDSSGRHGRLRDTDPVRNSLPAFASEAILEAMPVFGRRIKGFDGMTRG